MDTDNRNTAPTHRMFLGMPGYDRVTSAASRGFWRCSRYPNNVYWEHEEGSLLAQNFNQLWCTALNLVHHGKRVDYFAMQHSDIGPREFWLDDLIEELERHKLDILGVVAPIKDRRGCTSIALDRPGDTWNPLCRLTMKEIFRLPETFTSEDVGHPLLLNTGLWVCRFDRFWARKVHFTVNDRIVFDKSRDMYLPEVESEDWFFSRLCHELKLRIGCTRKINLTHRGDIDYENSHPWGDDYDRGFLTKSLIPEREIDGWRFPAEVDGWLTPAEGWALAELARDKMVLEIGSYCGRSTICMAQTSKRVTAVDPHDGRGTPSPRDTRDEFLANLNRYKLRNVASFDAIPAHWGVAEYDLVFIDGAHDLDQVRADIGRSLDLLKPGGLLAFHDYREFPGAIDGCWDLGVTRAVNELIAAGGKLLATHDTLAVVRPPCSSFNPEATPSSRQSTVGVASGLNEPKEVLANG